MVLLGAGILLYLGRHLFRESELVTWGLTFGGTTAACLLGMALYRVQLELRASRQELAMKQAELNLGWRRAGLPANRRGQVPPGARACPYLMWQEARPRFSRYCW